MRLTLFLLGVEVFAIATDAAPGATAEPGDCTATPTPWVGFTTDPRWQPGGEP